MAPSVSYGQRSFKAFVPAAVVVVNVVVVVVVDRAVALASPERQESFKNLRRS